jgi:hypothetical protein
MVATPPSCPASLRYTASVCSVYRDPAEGMRAKRMELSARIAERESSARPVFWENLPDDVRARLAEARAVALSGGDLTTSLAAAERYVAELEQALELLPLMEAGWNQLPVTSPAIPPEQLPSWSGVLRCTDDLPLERLRLLDPQLVIEESGFARFRTRGAPFSMRVQRLIGPSSIGIVTRIATGIRRATGRLVVEPELFRHGLFKALRLLDEIETGDLDFDARFLIRGDLETARTLLVRPLRRGLLEIARIEPPRLEVAEGRAQLCWKAAPTAASIDTALFVLSSVRSVPPTVRFR